MKRNNQTIKKTKSVNSSSLNLSIIMNKREHTYEEEAKLMRDKTSKRIRKILSTLK
ncbi:MAG: hypothetical protein K8S23_08120 [Candidatus Cloacimonetes bacterium]|nr:hypothetical protein [Candidatus Cloacimonadota bacterium]